MEDEGTTVEGERERKREVGCGCMETEASE